MGFKEWYFTIYNEDFDEENAHFGVFDEYQEFIATLENNKEYIVDVTEDGYVGYSGWVEEIYINNEKGEDYEDIFKQYVGKKIKLTIEVIG